MFSFLIGLIGSLIGLIGWFGFYSEIALFIGAALYIIETLMELKNLNTNAIITEIIIFLVGSFIGSGLSYSWYIGGIVALLLYSGVLGIFGLGVQLLVFIPSLSKKSSNLVDDSPVTNVNVKKENSCNDAASSKESLATQGKVITKNNESVKRVGKNGYIWYYIFTILLPIVAILNHIGQKDEIYETYQIINYYSVLNGSIYLLLILAYVVACILMVFCSIKKHPLLYNSIKAFFVAYGISFGYSTMIVSYFTSADYFYDLVSLLIVLFLFLMVLLTLNYYYFTKRLKVVECKFKNCFKEAFIDTAIICIVIIVLSFIILA